MGKPKRLRKKYESPKRPFEDLARDKAIMKEFGISTKREIWRAETELRNLRRRARKLQALKETHKGQLKEEKELLEKLNKLGLVATKIDDVLRLSISDFLARRLQTIVFKKGIGVSVKNARQIIVHGHVFIGDTRVKFPSMIVSKDEEEKIRTDIDEARAIKTGKQAQVMETAEKSAAEEKTE
jgi:small subunit ribosomal protein S4